MKIGNQKDFWSGVLFAAIGLIFVVVAKGVPLGEDGPLPGYAMGTAARMGPGYFPFYLGLILVALGVAIAFKALKSEGPKLERWWWRPIGFVLGGVILFGILLKALGMFLTGILLVVVASLGSTEFKARDVILLGIGLVIFCAGVFVYGLKLPIPLCPAIESIQAMAMCRI